MKISEAEQKCTTYDTLQQQYNEACNESAKATQLNTFLENKLQETQHLLGILETERRGEQEELKTLREQLERFKNEYVFYKETSETLETKLKREQSQFRHIERELTERIKDLEEANSSLD